jgi:hypothetical protein
MYEDFCTQQRKRADEHLAEFLKANSHCSLDHERPGWLKGTHLVTFGSCDGNPAVYKFYDGDPRKEHEKRALMLFEPTGLVPRIFCETDLMLVMERLSGSPMNETEKNLSEAERDELYSRLGRAVAKVVQVAPGSDAIPRSATSFRAADPSDFYNTPFKELHVLYRQADAATFFDTTLMRAARVLRDRDVPQKGILTKSLTALESSRDAILAHPSFVHMDDFHTNNIMADGVSITGFIDLEMTRWGNEVLLLGAALFSMARQPDRWPAFRRGYEEARGKPIDDRLLSIVRTAALFSTWIRFTWYWSTDDQPWWAKEGNLAASTVRQMAECVEAIEGR